tara:strand:+ start:1490 stop:1648 length:159 start_codon:yes stop_codon:yes gene_type:complete
MELANEVLKETNKQLVEQNEQLKKELVVEKFFAKFMAFLVVAITVVKIINSI